MVERLATSLRWVAWISALTALAGCAPDVVKDEPGTTRGGAISSTASPGPCPDAPPQPGTPCAGAATCDYDGACLGAHATCAGGAWKVEEHGVACAATCPQQVPASGATCDVCCSPPTCEYAVEGCSSTRAECRHDGTWQVSPGDCDAPPAPTCRSHQEALDCEADPACRWLVPGCTHPNLPEAGCFQKAECVSDAECAPLRCVPASVDPCWNKGCDTCFAKAMVCLP